MTFKKFIRVLAFISILVSGAGQLSPVFAVDSKYPSRPITIFVASQVGSGAYTTLRIVTDKLSQRTGWTFVLDPRPGAGGDIAAQAVMRSAPDGYSILFTHAGSIVQDPLLRESMSFDPQKDLKPVTAVSDTVAYLAVPTSLPAKSLAELAELSKKKPGGLNYGSYASITDLANAVLVRDSGLQSTSIGYKGSQPALVDLLAGRIDMLYTGLPILEGYLKSGKLRVLGVSGERRFERTPDVPTFAEQGVSITGSFSWWGIFAPAAMPDDVVATLHREFIKTMQDPVVREAMVRASSIPVILNSPQEFANWINADRAKTEKLIQDGGMKRR
jgi:tripartite-type tricarboxylate transporter receptor subunit TctC